MVSFCLDKGDISYIFFAFMWWWNRFDSGLFCCKCLFSHIWYDFILLVLSLFSPWRIVDDCGGAFSMGTLGGGIFQAVKGFRNAPLVRLRPITTKNASVLLDLTVLLGSSGLGTQTEGKCQCCQNKSATDWRWGGYSATSLWCRTQNCSLLFGDLQGALPSGGDSSPLSTVV